MFYLLTVDNNKPLRLWVNLVIFVKKENNNYLMTIHSDRNFNSFIAQIFFVITHFCILFVLYSLFSYGDCTLPLL